MIMSTQTETLTLTVPPASESEISYKPITLKANSLTLLNYNLPEDITPKQIEQSSREPNELLLMIGGLVGNSKKNNDEKTMKRFEFTKNLLNLIVYHSMHQFIFDQSINASLNREINILTSSKNSNFYLVFSTPFFTRNGTICLNSPKELKLLMWVQRAGVKTLEDIKRKQTITALDNLYKS